MKNTVLFLLFSALSLVPAANADTIFTDNLPTASDVYNTVGTVGNWTVLSGNVDLLQASGSYGYLCGGAASCIDLDGNTAGSITSGNLNLAPGTYVLTFTLLGDQRGASASATVSLGSLFNQTYTQAPGTVSQVIVVNSATTAALTFTSNTPGSAGQLLASGVSLATQSPVPEPSSLLLMSLPLLALAVVGFRRANSQA